MERCYGNVGRGTQRGSGGERTARLPSCHGREWTCLRQGMERQEEGTRERLLLKTRPDDAWGPAEGCTPHAPDSDLSSAFKSPLSSGVLCACLHSLVWGLKGHVNGGRRKLDSLSAGTCCERGRLDQELKPSRPHQAESGESKLALPGSRPPEEEAGT